MSKEQTDFSDIAIEVFYILLDTCDNSCNKSNCDGIVFLLAATFTLEADSGIEGVKRAFFLDGSKQVSQISGELNIAKNGKNCSSTIMYFRVSILNVWKCNIKGKFRFQELNHGLQLTLKHGDDQMYLCRFYGEPELPRMFFSFQIVFFEHVIPC